MIPNNNSDDSIPIDFEVVEEPSYTPYLNRDTYRINGFIDDIEAVKQSVYLILNVERYDWLIYSWNYGIELNDLYGEESNFAVAELERVITESLLQDDRINEVNDFIFKVEKNNIYVEFVVITIFGEFDYDFEFGEVA